MLKTKFALYDRVFTKRIGLPSVGTIVAVYDPSYYVIMVNADISGSNNWTRWYPEWYEKNVYTLRFDSPQKMISLEEYEIAFQKRHDSDQFTTEQIRGFYELNIPMVITYSYPEDDLEESYG